MIKILFLNSQCNYSCKDNKIYLAYKLDLNRE